MVFSPLGGALRKWARVSSVATSRFSHGLNFVCTCCVCVCVRVPSCVTSCAALSPCPQVTSACDIFPKGLSQSAEREFSSLPICSDCVIFDLFTSVGLQHIARKSFEYYYVMTVTILDMKCKIWQWRSLVFLRLPCWWFSRWRVLNILQIHIEKQQTDALSASRNFDFKMPFHNGCFSQRHPGSCKDSELTLQFQLYQLLKL